MWVVDHMADLESDFAVFHRVDDPLELPGPEFFRKAYRMPAYAGVMAARAVQASKTSQPSGQYVGAGSGETPREVPLAEVIALHPDLIEKG